MSKSTGLPLHRHHEPFGVAYVKRAFAGLGDRFRHFAAVNELELLSDRQLRDIGVERREIEEIAKREIARLRAR